MFYVNGSFWRNGRHTHALNKNSTFHRSKNCPVTKQSLFVGSSQRERERERSGVTCYVLRDPEVMDRRARNIWVVI